MRPVLLKRRDPRIWLADATRGFIHPAFAYSRSSTIVTRGDVGQLVTYAPQVLPRAYDPTLGWHYRMNPTWNQLCLRSTALTNATWTRTGMNTPVQSVSSPTGATDAWTYTEDTSTGTHSQSQSITFANATVYAITAIAVPGAGSRQLTMLLPAAAFGSDAIATFDLSSGTAVKNGTVLATEILALSGGYYQVTAYALSTAAAAGVCVWAVHRSASATVDSYTGDGTSGMSVYGMNVTDTAWMPPFVSSSGSTTTVNNSTLVATLSSILNLGTEYTLGVEFFCSPIQGTPPTRVVMQVDNGGTSERNVVRYTNSAGGLRLVSVAGGSSTNVDSFTISEGTRVKTAFRISAAGHKSAANSSLGSGASSTVPALGSTVRLGNDSGSSNNLVGGIVRAWLIPAPQQDGSLLAYSR